MRITAGKFRGLPLKAPRTQQIRPMMDKVRKSLFDSLGDKVAGAKVLDLFCGTGALGLEALSRGAMEVVFVDRSSEALAWVRENLKKARVTEGVKLLKRHLPGGLEGLAGPFDLIFITPPYGKGLAEKTLFPAAALLAPEGLVVVEIGPGETLPSETSSLTRVKKKRYGQTELHFYRRK